MGKKAVGYQDLPDFPLEPSDSSVRNVEIVPPLRSQYDQSRKSGSTFRITSEGKKKSVIDENFYSDNTDEDKDVDEETSTEGSEDHESEEEEELTEYEQLDARLSDVMQRQDQNIISSEELEEDEESDTEDESEDEEVQDLTKPLQPNESMI